MRGCGEETIKAGFGVDAYVDAAEDDADEDSKEREGCDSGGPAAYLLEGVRVSEED